MKPKNTTYLEKAGLTDSDLKTPAHDELCLWFNENHKTLLKSYLPSSKLNEIIEKYKNSNIIARYEIQWEQPIRLNNYFIGYIDFYVKVHLIIQSLDYTFQLCEFIIEIKPEIQSLGETFRQMKTYMSCMSNAIPIIVTNTKVNKDLFTSQKIHVIIKEDQK